VRPLTICPPGPGGIAMFQPDFVSETFEPLVVPFEHSSYSNTGHEVFLGLPPVADERGTT